MNSETLKKWIGEEIKNSLSQKINNPNLQKTNNYLNSEDLSEEEIDDFMFGKPKEESDKRVLTIKEQFDYEAPNLTTSEIKNFERSFEELLSKLQGATIFFDKQSNGYSIYGFKESDGVELIASGSINLGVDGKIFWDYSLKKGVTINTNKVQLTNSNKTLTEDIYNHYSSWQTQWMKNLNFPDSAI